MIADPKHGRAVFAEVAGFTRVCAYDRPGTRYLDETLSPSTPVAQPTSAKPAAADLDALLGASGEPPPYVLAGHSFGGPIVRLYAGAHPAEVGGLVLVDALSEDIWNGLTPKQEAVYDELNAPPPGSDAEYLDHPAIFRQLRESPPAPPVPTVVLTADQPQLPLTKKALAKEQFPAPTTPKAPSTFSTLSPSQSERACYSFTVSWETSSPHERSHLPQKEG